MDGGQKELDCHYEHYLRHCCEFVTGISGEKTHGLWVHSANKPPEEDERSSGSSSRPRYYVPPIFDQICMKGGGEGETGTFRVLWFSDAECLPGGARISYVLLLPACSRHIKCYTEGREEGLMEIDGRVLLPGLHGSVRPFIASPPVRT